jgi:hypothetical protein
MNINLVYRPTIEDSNGEYNTYVVGLIAGL